MGKLYKFFRPLLMALPPEAAHSLSLKCLGLIPKAPEPDPVLATEVSGLHFKSPVGLAAGYDKDAKTPSKMGRLGFGLVEVGTLTPNPQTGNPAPRIFRLKEDRAVINHLGFNNQGFEAALECLSAFPKKGRNIVLGINIGANKTSKDPIGDYVQGITAFAPVADYFTINISSPNTPGLRDLQEKGALEVLVKALKKALGKAQRSTPVFIKIAPDLTKGQLREILGVAQKQKIDGLIISNTTVTRPQSLASENKKEPGGLSGQPLFEPSTTLLREAFKISKGKLTLIGVGGVASAEQAYEKIKNGASLIQLYTGLVYEGPGLVKDLNKGLVRLLKADGYKSVSEAVGKSVKI